MSSRQLSVNPASSSLNVRLLPEMTSRSFSPLYQYEKSVQQLLNINYADKSHSVQVYRGAQPTDGFHSSLFFKVVSPCLRYLMAVQNHLLSNTILIRPDESDDSDSSLQGETMKVQVNIPFNYPYHCSIFVCVFEKSSNDIMQWKIKLGMDAT